MPDFSILSFKISIVLFKSAMRSSYLFTADSSLLIFALLFSLSRLVELFNLAKMSFTLDKRVYTSSITSGNCSTENSLLFVPGSLGVN